MLRTLVETSRNLASSGAMIHPGYREFSKSNPIDWVLHIGPDGRLMSRPEKVEIRKPRPSRIRTGKPGPGNLKPYLLVDEARYVLGVQSLERHKKQNCSTVVLLTYFGKLMSLPKRLISPLS